MSTSTILRAPSSSVSTTATATVVGPFQGTTPLRKPAPINPLAQACSNCGADLTHSHLAEDSQRRIAELEAQVDILAKKATTAVDKLADYEDELRRIKSAQTTPTAANAPSSALSNPPPTSTPQQQQQQQQQQQPPPQPDPPSSPQPPIPTIPTPPPVRPTAASRLTSLLPSNSISRRTSSTPSTPNSPRLPKELQAMLTHEQTLRLAAERRVTQTNSELEELSAQLFTEANEMVATERKARARLEERVVVLERREREKAGRLEVLERRVGRVERVRGILAQQAQVQQGAQGGGG